MGFEGALMFLVIMHNHGKSRPRGVIQSEQDFTGKQKRF